MTNTNLDLDRLMKKAAGKIQKSRRVPKLKLPVEDCKKLVWGVLQQIMKSEDREFESNRHNKVIIQNLILYFLGDKRCKWDLKKGLFFFGDVGLGKSLMMKIFKVLADTLDIDHHKFRFVVTTDIYDRIVKHKNPAILQEYYSGNICFDDLGDEPVYYQHYANTVQLMASILSKRERAFKDGKLITHITSNLTPDDIEKRYGTRIKDRFDGMFNEVFFDGKSNRK